ncbi:hypothetical protein BaRGS_00029085 [Batillaria attramentaria]|uniref:Uncharacterized protein n=1 Tax=Batillaria attramentaria TaxID=370345 RepID=A0ABD0JY80_9CAEN
MILPPVTSTVLTIETNILKIRPAKEENRTGDSRPGRALRSPDCTRRSLGPRNHLFLAPGGSEAASELCQRKSYAHAVVGPNISSKVRVPQFPVSHSCRPDGLHPSRHAIRQWNNGGNQRN